jgi:hypothetical protein
MAINVRCPNDACGKMLSVRDDFAGKTGKCPNCGTLMPIPDAAGEEPIAAVLDTETEAAAKSPPTAPAEEEPIPVRPYLARRRREDDDFDEPRPRRRRYEDEEEMPPVRRSGGHTAFVGTIVCLSVGIALLILLGLTPIFSMYAITFPNMPIAGFAGNLSPPVSGMLFLTEGKILLIVSQVAAALCIAGLIVFLTAAPRVADIFVTICSCVAGGWGVAALFWVLAFIWDINTMSLARQVAPQLFGTGMAPGVGLWIGLGASIALVAVFSALITIRGRTAWLYLSEGLGLVAGVLLLTLNVQPWVSDEPADHFSGKPTKLSRRYLPLQAWHPLVNPKLDFGNRNWKP